MPAKTTFPDLKFHKGLGQHYYFHDGKKFYLGSDPVEARERHRWAILELNGAPPVTVKPLGGLVVAEAVKLYLSGPVAKKERRERVRHKFALTHVAQQFPMMLADQFRVVHIEAIAAQWSTMRRRNRNYKLDQRDGAVFSGEYVCKLLSAVRQCWAWLAMHDHVTADSAAKVSLGVSQAAKSTTKANQKTRPVTEDDLRATLAELPPTCSAMVRTQLATGMRTGEMLSMRWEEIDRTGDVWEYSPGQHKNAWRGHRRTIYLGKSTQGILGEPLKAGPVWDVAPVAFYHALRRAQDRAAVAPWRAYQLRHLAATHVRTNHTDAATIALLGHAGDDLLRLYAGGAEEERARRRAG